LGMNDPLETPISARARSIHDRALVIDGLGGYGFEYSSILAGGIHATNVTLNMYASEGFEYVLNQIRRYYAILENDPENIKLIMQATNALARLVKTRYNITKEQKKGLKEAIGNVLRDVALPLGIGIGAAINK